MLQASTKGDTKKRMQAMVRKQAGRVSSYEDSRELLTQSIKRDAKRCVWGNRTRYGIYEELRKSHAIREDLREAASRLKVLRARNAA